MAARHKAMNLGPGKVAAALRVLAAALVGGAFFSFLTSARVLAQPALEPASRAELTKIEPFPSRSSARLVFHLSQPVRHEVVTRRGKVGLKGPRIKLPGTSYGGPLKIAMRGLLRGVELTPMGGALAVQLDVSRPASVHVFYLPRPFRLILDVREHRPLSSPSSRGIWRIALDPGHGGKDPGAMSGRGLLEKNVVLDIALRAAPLIASDLGIATLLTRDTDERVPLVERVAKANAFGADLFLSIHCNADRLGRAHGYMSFVLDGTHSEMAGQPLTRENGTAPGDLAYMRQFFPTRPDSSHTASRSRRFAALLQRASQASLDVGYSDARNGGVHGAGFYVLAGAQMPAVLFESSFISHPVEGRRLGRVEYRQKLADAIVNAVRAYGAGL